MATDDNMQQALSYAHALTAVAAAEDRALRDPDHNRQLGTDDADWKVVYAHLAETSREDPAKGAQEALKLRTVVIPGGPLSDVTWQVFREDIAALEQAGQNMAAMNLLAQDVAPDQEKRLSEPLKGKTSNPTASASDENGMGASIKSASLPEGDVKPGAASSQAQAVTSQQPGQTINAKAALGPLTATDSIIAGAEHENIPQKSPYPLTENEQATDTTEYLRLASLNAQSQQSLVAVTHSLAGMLSSDSDPMKDPGKTSTLWEMLGQDATRVYQQDATAPDVARSQAKQMMIDKGQVTQDLESLVAALRGDQQKNAGDADRVAYDESHIQMMKELAFQAGNVTLKDGNNTPDPTGLLRTGQQQNAGGNGPDGPNTPKATAPDGGMKNFPVQAHDPSQLAPAQNAQVAVPQLSSTPGLQ